MKKEPPTCKFVPYGRDRFNCIDNCIESDNCDYLKCKSICDSCNDQKTCPWIETSDLDLKTYKEFPDEIAIPLYNKFISKLSTESEQKVYSGKFGAEMKVKLINDGPVTIILDSKKKFN